ncbi:pirin family protein [Candidatus Odyssella acanthamoebae]|uniref:Quercetin 2,3-dioxygenase n=1 Tax=Candidatus Odyssella acanthamoebae TaxID=91604 RepID=A0A077AZ92_9PROT|nr:quercetin 2,3-dioxygenase [Candidatus Paracaedibacter acanthamoebae]
MKMIVQIKAAVAKHWVGDGFPVRTLFSYRSPVITVSPFLLLDYAGPEDFKPTDKIRGVDKHPHRGFETVTIVYSGQLEHRDNAGHTGKIGAGDVQWMTAGRGVLHEEWHGEEFSKAGGVFEVVQLWVNLPIKDKMTKPKYQEIIADRIPVLNGDGWYCRIIAGNYLGVQGAATTFSSINVWDMHSEAHTQQKIEIPEGYSTILLLRRGKIMVNDAATLEAGHITFFDTQGDAIEISTLDDAEFLLLSGEVIDEPIVGAGPFVMHSEEELKKAYADYREGRF